jgi:hypothetical protein
VATTAHPSPAQTKPLPSPAARATLRAISLWHLHSLDAPTVAAVWTWFLAASNHIQLPAVSIFAMAIAVWMLYAADRLLDARLLDRCADTNSIPSRFPRHEKLEARHLFHYRHRRVFRGLLVLGSLALALLLPQLASASIRLYLFLGALLVGYFFLIHARQPNRLPKVPLVPLFSKELAVGFFFSAAAFIPTVAREPVMRLILLPAALLFALLCSLNCLFIHAWEHPHAAPSTHPATRLALNSLRGLTRTAVLVSLLLAALSPYSRGHLPPWPIPTAIALAALLLLLLDHLHRSHRLAPTPLRACADLCLLTPLLLLPLLHT